jgi:hypothetical protein
VKTPSESQRSEMADEPVEFASLLDYELRSSIRYRRPVSLVSIGRVGTRVDLRKLLETAFRDSDELFELGGGATIIMGQTDRDGAVAAVNRYKQLCTEEIDLRFAVACFPDDGHNAQDLIASLHRRLQRAMTLDRGGVVAGG